MACKLTGCKDCKNFKDECKSLNTGVTWSAGTNYDGNSAPKCETNCNKCD